MADAAENTRGLVLDAETWTMIVYDYLIAYNLREVDTGTLIDSLIPLYFARTGTFRARHRDGSIRWTFGTARNLLTEPRVGAVVVYLRDVTGMREAEAARKVTEDRYRQLFEDATDVIFEEVKLTKKNVVGTEGDGFKVAMRTFDRTRPWIAQA